MFTFVREKYKLNVNYLGLPKIFLDFYELTRQEIFLKCFENKCFTFAKLIHSKGAVDIHFDNDYVFRYSCENGHLEVAKWLYSLGTSNRL